MEKESSSVTPLAMSHGLYMGLALVLNSVIWYVMGSPFAPTGAYISYAIIIGGIAWTMRSYRDSNPEAGMPYGRALGLGTLQSLFAALILAFFTFVLFKLIDPSLIDKFFTFLEEQILRSGTSENQAEAVITMYRKVMSPLVYSLAQVFSVTFYGFIFSLILAIFFKKQPVDPFHGVE
jgi:hypothetical protein